MRREKDAESLREQASDRLIPVMLDVTDAVSIEQATKTVEDTVGPAGLDGLVNNAGFGIPGPLEFVPIDDARNQFEIILFGPLPVTQALLPLLRRGNGRIVNMGSMGDRVAFPFMGIYSAPKFALDGLTDAFRVELSPWKLHVSLIEPGSIATPGWDKLKRGAEETARTGPAGRTVCASWPSERGSTEPPMASNKPAPPRLKAAPRTTWPPWTFLPGAALCNVTGVTLPPCPSRQAVLACAR